MKRVLVSITFRREDGHICSAEKKKEGGRWYTEVYGFDSLPLFVRENTLLPIGNNEKTATYHYPEQLQILVYPLEEDKIAECIVPDEKGNEVLDITARYKDEKNCSVQFRGK